MAKDNENKETLIEEKNEHKKNNTKEKIYKDDRTKEYKINSFKTRLNDMRSARKNFEDDRNVIDLQVESKTYYRDGILQVNVPLEQNLIEMSCGRFAWHTDITIEPIGVPNVDELMPAKYSLQHFMYMWWFHDEKKSWRLDKATYGTWILFTGISYTARPKFTPKKSSNDLFDTEYIETKEETYVFTPKNVAIRSVYIDDRAIRQPDQKLIRDVIWQENISKEELITRYKDKKWFNIPAEDSIKEEYNTNKPYWNQATQKIQIDWNTIILYHYFNRECQDYQIFIGEKDMIFDGKMIYKHLELPREFTQHYPRNNCIYGRGIPHKVRYLKAYKSEMMQWMLDKVRASSGINIGLWNTTSVSGDLYTASGEINIWNFTWGIDQVKQFQLDGNINWYEALLNLIDDMAIQDTGENLKAPYSSPAKTLGETEIIEENKMIRIQSVNEADDMGLGRALTMSLDNITQFAPYLLKTTKKWTSGIDIDQFPTIIVPWAQIKVENKEKEDNEVENEIETDDMDEEEDTMNADIQYDETKFTEIEDYGNYGSFEFKPDMIMGRFRVRVSTASTESKLNYIEKNKFTQYLQNKAILWEANPELLGKEDWDSMLELINLVYGYGDKFVANTKKSLRKKKWQEAVSNLLSLINWTGNENPNQPPVPWAPQPQGQIDPSAEGSVMNAEGTWPAPL